ncbi:hypothetical protein [Sorangium sp. So ce145]
MALCGNGVVEAGKDCYGGNRSGGEGCSAKCRSDKRCAQ